MEDNHFIETWEADFKLPIPASRDVATSTNAGDVKTTISLEYYKMNGQIKLVSASGSWKPLNSYITIQEREVHFYDQAIMSGHRAHKYPSSNSFNYQSGWGYVDEYPHSDVSGAGGYSYARAVMSGGIGHVIELRVRIL